ncbi:hypothetical protein TWF788_007991 [Orbilia oligospora]|uniref:Uncharacterized protein n=1 Tax=Orbilia oligospora TaxID=2813651 RepID=A0A7C8PHZ1_ORBOL|nr:hypothetical protein TWF788_007991 [Orbilia oligospora]
MPRYTCHHALRLLTPSKIRLLDTHHHFHTTYLSTNHRIWDPPYPTFLSLTHTQSECFELDSSSGGHSSIHHNYDSDGSILTSYEEQREWKERLMGRRLVNGGNENTTGKDGGDGKIFDVQSLPAGKDQNGPTCTRIIGPLKGMFSDIVESRLTIHVDENDIVWDVYIG